MRIGGNEIIVPDGKVYNVEKNIFYDTIQEAIDDADPGNTLLVGNGTFEEQVTINKKNLILKAQNEHGATIKAPAFTVRQANLIPGNELGAGFTQEYYDWIIRVNAENVTIKGLKIEGYDGHYDGEKHRHSDGVWRGSAEGDVSRDIRRIGFFGILYYDGSSGVIENNKVSEIVGWATFGMKVNDAGVVMVQGNEINVPLYGNVGISAGDATVEVNNNTITGNDGSTHWSQTGIQFSKGEGSANGNTVIDFRSGTSALSVGIMVVDEGEVEVIESNSVTNADAAILVWNGDPAVTATVNYITGNIFTDNERGIVFYPGSIYNHGNITSNSFVNTLSRHFLWFFWDLSPLPTVQELEAIILGNSFDAGVIHRSNANWADIVYGP